MYCNKCKKCMDNECEENKPCGETCIPHEKIIVAEGLAVAYVPFQIYCSNFSPVQSLLAGTTFPELYKPYKKHCEK